MAEASPGSAADGTIKRRLAFNKENTCDFVKKIKVAQNHNVTLSESTTLGKRRRRVLVLRNTSLRRSAFRLKSFVRSEFNCQQRFQGGQRIPAGASVRSRVCGQTVRGIGHRRFNLPSRALRFPGERDAQL